MDIDHESTRRRSSADPLEPPRFKRAIHEEAGIAAQLVDLGLQGWDGSCPLGGDGP